MRHTFYQPRSLRPASVLLAFPVLAFSLSIGLARADSATDTSEVPAAQTPDIEKISVQSAADAWDGLVKSSLTGVNSVLPVSGTQGTFTFGAEKEGSSSMITRVMSPNAERLLTMITALDEEHRRTYLTDFFKNYANGRYRNQPIDMNGKLIPVPQIEKLSPARLKAMSDVELVEKYQDWVMQNVDRPFSFLKPSVRQKIFNGTSPGLDPTSAKILRLYGSWAPLYGKPQTYIERVHSTTTGWEINFLPQSTYAEDDRMIDWFRHELKNGGNLFDAPGHQRMVFPRRRKEIVTEMDKLAETYRAVQAYIWLRSQEGRSGAEGAAHKGMSRDELLANTHDTNRDVLRLEVNKYVTDSLGVEVRAGTKSTDTRRFVKQVIASRYASNDFSGISSIRDYSFIDGKGMSAPEIAKRFGVTNDVAERFLKQVKSFKFEKKGRTVSIENVPAIWKWENAPYLSAEKKALVKDLTRTFITSVADWNHISQSEFQDALATWAKASNLSEDLETYLKPVKRLSADQLDRLVEYQPRLPPIHGAVDVNKIDLGIEYTARFPIKSRSKLSEQVLADGKKVWLESQFDLSPEERKATLSRVADTLARRLDPDKNPELEFVTGSGHGNSLESAFEFKDSKMQKWRVEWDGIGRDYTGEGEVVTGSPRGGHIEVVTPKFNPTTTEIKAVQDTFRAHSLIPSTAMGGGHINVDLEPFNGKPRELARLLARLNEVRDVAAILFQDPRRLKSAEPLEVDPELQRKLMDFNGSENDLKKLLYDSKYFNTRVGRKSRYAQFDLTAYFQDVIPPEYIHQDFDIKNDLWRKNFDVDPKVRKAEARLFNAPRNEEEAALQIKFMRALLNDALNEHTPLTGHVADVNYNKYVENPTTAYHDLETVAQKLGLDAKDFHSQLTDSLANARSVLASDVYIPFAKAVADHPKIDGWAGAVAPRSSADALKSDDRIWTENKSDPIAHQIHARNQEVRTTAQQIREKYVTENPEAGLLKRRLGTQYQIENITLRNRPENLTADENLRVIYNTLKSNRGEHDEAIDSAIEKLKQNPYFDDHLSTALDSPDFGFRHWAAGLIGEDHLDSLEKALTSEDPVVRGIGFSVMDQQPTEKYLSEITRITYSSPDSAVLTDLVSHALARLPPTLSEDMSGTLGQLIFNVLESDNQTPHLLELVRGHIGLVDPFRLGNLIGNPDAPLAARLEILKYARTLDQPLHGVASCLSDAVHEIWAIAHELLQPYMNGLTSQSEATRNASYEKLTQLEELPFDDKKLIVLESGALRSDLEPTAGDAVKFLLKNGNDSNKLVLRILDQGFDNFTERSEAFQKTIAHMTVNLASDRHLAQRELATVYESPYGSVRAEIFSLAEEKTLEEDLGHADHLVLKGLNDTDPAVRAAAQLYLSDWVHSANSSSPIGVWGGTSSGEMAVQRLTRLPVDDQAQILLAGGFINGDSEFLPKAIELSSEIKLEALPEHVKAINDRVLQAARTYVPHGAEAEGNFFNSVERFYNFSDDFMVRNLQSAHPHVRAEAESNIAELIKGIKERRPNDLYWWRFSNLRAANKFKMLGRENFLSYKNANVGRYLKLTLEFDGAEYYKHFPAEREKAARRIKDLLNHLKRDPNIGDDDFRKSAYEDATKFFHRSDRKAIENLASEDLGARASAEKELSALADDLKSKGPQFQLALSRYSYLNWEEKEKFILKSNLLRLDHPNLPELIAASGLTLGRVNIYTPAVRDMVTQILHNPENYAQFPTKRKMDLMAASNKFYDEDMIAKLTSLKASGLTAQQQLQNIDRFHLLESFIGQRTSLISHLADLAHAGQIPAGAEEHLIDKLTAIDRKTSGDLIFKGGSDIRDFAEQRARFLNYYDDRAAKALAASDPAVRAAAQAHLEKLRKSLTEPGRDLQMHLIRFQQLIITEPGLSPEVVKNLNLFANTNPNIQRTIDSLAELGAESLPPEVQKKLGLILADLAVNLKRSFNFDLEHQQQMLRSIDKFYDRFLTDPAAKQVVYTKLNRSWDSPVRDLRPPIERVHVADRVRGCVIDSLNILRRGYRSLSGASN